MFIIYYIYNFFCILQDNHGQIKIQYVCACYVNDYASMHVYCYTYDHVSKMLCYYYLFKLN